jgi:hypothetical protein
MIKNISLDRFFSGFNSTTDDQVLRTGCINSCVVQDLIQRYKPKTFLAIGAGPYDILKTVKAGYPHIQMTIVRFGDHTKPKDSAVSKQRSNSEITFEILLKCHPDIKEIKETLEEALFNNKKFDVVLLDRSSRYQETLKDTNRAFSLVTPGGLLVWNKLNTAEGVTAALSMFEDLEIIHPIHSSIGFCKVP